jgi:hypothetical protein
VIPLTGTRLNNNWIATENATIQENNQIDINAPGTIGGAYTEKIPYNCRITLEIEPKGNNDEYGLFLRCNDKAADGYKLSFSPNLQTVRLHNTHINAISGLNQTIIVDIILKDDIIDVCIDGKRCIVNRLPEKRGEYLWLYAKQGQVDFKNIKVFPLL